MCAVKTLIKLRPLLLSIHRVGGLVAVLFFLVLAGTGCAMAFEAEGVRKAIAAIVGEISRM